MSTLWIYELIWNQWRIKHPNHKPFLVVFVMVCLSTVIGASALMFYLLESIPMFAGTMPTVATNCGKIALAIAGLSGILRICLQIAIVIPRAKVLFAKLAHIKKAGVITLAIINSPRLVDSHEYTDHPIKDSVRKALIYLGFQPKQIKVAQGSVLDAIKGRHWPQLNAAEEIDLILRIHINSRTHPLGIATSAAGDVQLINTNIRNNEVSAEKREWTYYCYDHKLTINNEESDRIVTIAKMILMDLINESELTHLTTCKAST